MLFHWQQFKGPKPFHRDMPPSVHSNPERQAPTEIQPPSSLDLVTASSVSRDESPHLTSTGESPLSARTDFSPQFQENALKTLCWTEWNYFSHLPDRFRVPVIWTVTVKVLMENNLSAFSDVPQATVQDSARCVLVSWCHPANHSFLSQQGSPYN